MSLVSRLVAKTDSPEQSSAQPETAEGERFSQMKDFRKDANSWWKARAEMAQKINLKFERLAERFSNLEEAMTEQQRQKALLKSKSFYKFFCKNSSSKKKRKTRKSRKDFDASDEGLSNNSSSRDLVQKMDIEMVCLQTVRWVETLTMTLE